MKNTYKTFDFTSRSSRKASQNKTEFSVDKTPIIINLSKRTEESSFNDSMHLNSPKFNNTKTIKFKKNVLIKIQKPPNSEIKSILKSETSVDSKRSKEAKFSKTADIIINNDVGKNMKKYSTNISKNDTLSNYENSTFRNSIMKHKTSINLKPIISHSSDNLIREQSIKMLTQISAYPSVIISPIQKPKLSMKLSANKLTTTSRFDLKLRKLTNSLDEEERQISRKDTYRNLGIDSIDSLNNNIMSQTTKTSFNKTKQTFYIDPHTHKKIMVKSHIELFKELNEVKYQFYLKELEKQKSSNRENYYFQEYYYGTEYENKNLFEKLERLDRLSTFLPKDKVLIDKLKRTACNIEKRKVTMKFNERDIGLKLNELIEENRIKLSHPNNLNFMFHTHRSLRKSNKFSKKTFNEKLQYDLQNEQDGPIFKKFGDIKIMKITNNARKDINNDISPEIINKSLEKKSSLKPKDKINLGNVALRARAFQKKLSTRINIINDNPLIDKNNLKFMAKNSILKIKPQKESLKIDIIEALGFFKKPKEYKK